MDPKSIGLAYALRALVTAALSREITSSDMAAEAPLGARAASNGLAAVKEHEEEPACAKVSLPDGRTLELPVMTVGRRSGDSLREILLASPNPADPTAPCTCPLYHILCAPTHTLASPTGARRLGAPPPATAVLAGGPCALPRAAARHTPRRRRPRPRPTAAAAPTQDEAGNLFIDIRKLQPRCDACARARHGACSDAPADARQGAPRSAFDGAVPVRPSQWAVRARRCDVVTPSCAALPPSGRRPTRCTNATPLAPRPLLFRSTGICTFDPGFTSTGGLEAQDFAGAGAPAARRGTLCARQRSARLPARRAPVARTGGRGAVPVPSTSSR